MIKRIIILEDTRRNIFGGGQLITKNFISSIYNLQNIEIFIFDDARNNYFLSQIKTENLIIHLYSTHLSIFKIVNFFKSLKNILQLTYTKHKCILYAPTGFGLLASFIIKIINKKIDIIFHAHKPFPKGIFKKFIFKSLLSKCFKIITVSNYLKNNFNLNGYQTNMIYNCLDNSLKKNPKKILIDKDKIHIVMVANFISYKNHILLLRIIPKLYEEFGTKINFHFFGEGTKKIKKIISPQLLSIIKLHGFIKDPLNFFSNLEAYLIIPSNEPETFSINIIEAFKNNVLVIASNLGAHSELIKNKKTGYLIDRLEDQYLLKLIISAIKKDNSQILFNAQKYLNDNFSFIKFRNSIRKLIL